MELANTMEAVVSMAATETAMSRRDQLQRVFARTVNGLYRYILIRVGGDRNVADDLLQQSCCIAAGHRRVPREDDECEAWLRGVARNVIKQHWRQHKRRRKLVSMGDEQLSGQLVEELESGPLLTDLLESDIVKQEVMLAVTALPDTDQKLVFDYYYDGQSQQNLADELNVSVKAVEARLYRIRKRLKALLKNPERER